MNTKTILFLSFLVFTYPLFSDEMEESFTAERNRNYSKAMESVESLLKSSPNDYFLNLRAGWLSLLKGEYAKSGNYYSKATLATPSSIEARMGHAKALRAQGLDKQADVVCKAILNIDPKNYYARSTIAYSAYISGDYKESEKMYLSITSDYPSDTEMQIGLGWSYLKQGKKAEAKKIFAFLNKIIPKEERVSSGVYYSNN